MLKLINCTARPMKKELFKKAFDRKIESLVNGEEELTITDLMSVVFLGVKAFSINKSDIKDSDNLMSEFKCMDYTRNLMAQLTPKQFVNTFPIRKTYDGERYECKDYFYTVAMVNALDPYLPIGDKIDDFLWDYMNRDTQLFCVAQLSLMSEIMRSQGKPGILDQWSAEKGLPLYYADNSGKTITGPITIEKVDDEYYYDESAAQVNKFKKPRPKHLKVIN